MPGVRQPGETDFLGTHAQNRETNCLDGCDRSRREEPLRTGSGQLAAFKRCAQADARAHAGLARLAKAMTTRTHFEIAEISGIAPADTRIGLQAVCFREPATEFVTAGLIAIHERRWYRSINMRCPFAIVCN
jgi:hypothetical protein